jgi:hypothetical protein
VRFTVPVALRALEVLRAVGSMEAPEPPRALESAEAPESLVLAGNREVAGTPERRAR